MALSWHFTSTNCSSHLEQRRYLGERSLLMKNPPGNVHPLSVSPSKNRHHIKFLWSSVQTYMEGGSALSALHSLHI